MRNFIVRSDNVVTLSCLIASLRSAPKNRNGSLRFFFFFVCPPIFLVKRKRPFLFLRKGVKTCYYFIIRTIPIISQSLHYNTSYSTTTMSSIGQNIKKLRKEKNISQDKLSKLADISLNTVVKLELDQSPNPTLDTLKKVAKAFNISIDDLVK